ncbi:MAG TPA: endonuclease MutS2 [Clostridiales bacterium]|jgi:DNA mismatch repair protein MutS2|nr:endonuclease MutS2 [Clostridiales bacterium]
MAAFDKAIISLELNLVLEMLADCAQTEGAKNLIRQLRPSTDANRIRYMLEQTSDAKRLSAIKGTPPLSGVRDVTDSLARAVKGSALNTRELLDIASLLNITRRLKNYLTDGSEFETSLDEIFARLIPLRFLEDRINRVIVAEDMISDDASPELSDIRRKMRNAAGKVKESLQRYTGGAYSKYLQENIVTLRNGRYVIPVRSEYKNEIKGLIHDTSASGATVFIEPMGVVDANNELKELESREKHEIERILAELSAECADNESQINLNYYNITQIAFIFAKAEFSYRLAADAPQVTDERRIELYSARHPLIDKNKVVPVNITIGGGYDTLVITGPNTGGKTVALKTIGLFELMAQSGLHIPASDASVVCVFDDILADIGDEQSIEQSLSTFSGHMVNIIDILGKCNERTLALFDELGAGTDPVEGAALAEAILVDVRERRSMCAATTHYAELKAYALETEGVTNASCEFDVETLKPTYKLIIGTPGKSNAFAIAEKLGIHTSIIERAKSLISSDSKRFEYVIEKLEASRIEMERQREAAASARREYERFKAESEKRIREKEESYEKELERSRRQAHKILSAAQRTSDMVLGELERLKREKESERFALELEEGRRAIRSALRETEDIVNPARERTADDYVLPRPLKKGDEVILINIGTKGVVTEEPGDDGIVSVRAGIINTKTSEKNLMLASDAEEYGNTGIPKEKKKKAVSDYKVSVVRDFKIELDLRGMTGEEGWSAADKYLDEARIASVNSVTLIHGKGTGALKKAIWQYLKGDSRVKSFRQGVYGEGDSGVTVVELK